jgi:hypothetical protein
MVRVKGLGLWDHITCKLLALNSHSQIIHPFHPVRVSACPFGVVLPVIKIATTERGV